MHLHIVCKYFNLKCVYADIVYTCICILTQYVPRRHQQVEAASMWYQQAGAASMQNGADAPIPMVGVLVCVCACLHMCIYL